MYRITAACLCNTGRIRKNNEDNFYFNGEYLEKINNGITVPRCLEKNSSQPFLVGIYDGMGGENDGEEASYTAAKTMAAEAEKVSEYRGISDFLLRSSLRLNAAVVERAHELDTNYMGTTLVELGFSNSKAAVCNLGDSRAFVLRGKKMLQLSTDHVDETAYLRGSRKAPLTQHLGIDPEDYLIEPAVKEWNMEQGDRFLLCSDGVTDMVTVDELTALLSQENDDAAAVQHIVDTALANGGRDNITAIVCTCREKTQINEKRSRWKFFWQRSE